MPANIGQSPPPGRQSDPAYGAVTRKMGLAELAHAAGTDWALGTHARAAAMLADGATAERLYREAIERLARMHTSRSQTLARAHLLYGEWLRREHRRVDAREQLRVAHTMLADMGADAFAERARRELLATGETVRKRTVETLDELTPQEVQVARLAADGQTNPEIGAQLFLSPRTVEWHLTKVFGKLGIGSRKELRAALSDVEQPSSAAGSDPSARAKPGLAARPTASRLMPARLTSTDEPSPDGDDSFVAGTVRGIDPNRVSPAPSETSSPGRASSSETVASTN